MVKLKNSRQLNEIFKNVDSKTLAGNSMLDFQSFNFSSYYAGGSYIRWTYYISAYTINKKNQISTLA